MSQQSVIISNKTAEAMLEQLTSMEKQIAKMKKQLAQIFHKPKYGSAQWWEQEEREVDKDIKAGRLYRLNDASDLDKPLSQLKPWK
jgi:hypothetical protein